MDRFLCRNHKDELNPVRMENLLSKNFQPLLLSKVELPTPFLSEHVPAMTGQERVAYQLLFEILDPKGVGYLEATTVQRLFMTSGLSLQHLAQIWTLADQDQDGYLDSNEFAVAVHLIRCFKNGISILHSVDAAALLPIPETEDGLKGKQERLSLLREKKQQLLHLKGRKLHEMMWENCNHRLEKEDIRISKLQLMLLYQLQIITKEKVCEEENKLEKASQRLRNMEVNKERLKKEIQRLEEALIQVCTEQCRVSHEVIKLQPGIKDQKSSHHANVLQHSNNTNHKHCVEFNKKVLTNQTQPFNPFSEEFVQKRPLQAVDANNRRKSNGFKGLEEDFFRLLLEQGTKYPKQRKETKAEEFLLKAESDIEETVASSFIKQLLNNGITEKREELMYLKQKLDEIKRQKKLLWQEKRKSLQEKPLEGDEILGAAGEDHYINGLIRPTEISVKKCNGFIEIKPNTRTTPEINELETSETKNYTKEDNMSHYTVIQQQLNSLPVVKATTGNENVINKTKFVTITCDRKQEIEPEYVETKEFMDININEEKSVQTALMEEISQTTEHSNITKNNNVNSDDFIENKSYENLRNKVLETGYMFKTKAENDIIDINMNENVPPPHHFVMNSEPKFENNCENRIETIKTDEQMHSDAPIEQNTIEGINAITIHDQLLESVENVLTKVQLREDGISTVIVVDEITNLKKSIPKDKVKDLPSHYHILQKEVKLSPKKKPEVLVFEPEEIEELERERKALIGSLVIRHKAIKKWNINDDSPDAEALTFDPFKLESLRRQAENQLEELEDLDEVEVQTESLRKYLERKQLKMQEKASQEKEEVLKSPTSPQAQGVVDTQSIIDNKLQTKKYWEDKMSEEKQVSTKYVEIKINVQNKVNHLKSDKLTDNMATKDKIIKKTKLNDLNENEKAYQEYQSDESSPEEVEYGNESIIDREIRLALERENKLRQEREAVLRELESTQQNHVVESDPKGHRGDKTESGNTGEYYRRPENIIEMEIREQQQREEEFRREGNLKGVLSANKEDQQSEDEHNEKMAEFSAQESLLEREIRLQREKELRLVKDRILAQSEEQTELAENDEDRNHSRPPSEGSSESAYYSSAENLIAQEIKDLQEREEELRQIREQMIQRTISESLSSPRELENNHQALSPQPDIIMTRRLSHDSISSSQGSSTGDTVNRSERIKVRPYEEPSSDSIDSKYMPLNETPIEREIRSLNEREEALRKEKGSLPPQKTEEKHINKKEKPNFPKLKSKSSFENVQDTQRYLATTLLQKEIEEQKQRELELRKSGHIRTTSEEHVDIISAKSMENLNSYSVENNRQMAHVSRSVSLQNFMSKDDSDLPSSMTTFKPPSPLSPNLLAPFNNPGPPPIPQGLKLNTSTISSYGSRGTSPTPKVLPGQSSTLPRKMPPNSIQQSAAKNISIEKFISSHGKKINPISNTFTLNSPSGVESHPFRKMDYDDLTMVRLSNTDEELRPSPRRTYQTAESKIEQELRDMKEREEELRKQRARQINLGLSQSENSVLEKDIMAAVSTEHRSAKPKKKPLVKYKKNIAEEAEKKLRRQSSALIAQWEEMIQHKDPVTK